MCAVLLRDVSSLKRVQALPFHLSPHFLLTWSRLPYLMFFTLEKLNLSDFFKMRHPDLGDAVRQFYSWPNHPIHSVNASRVTYFVCLFYPWEWGSLFLLLFASTVLYILHLLLYSTFKGILFSEISCSDFTGMKKKGCSQGSSNFIHQVFHYFVFCQCNNTIFFHCKFNNHLYGFVDMLAEFL